MGVRDAILGATVGEELVKGPCGTVLVRGLTVAGKDTLQLAVLSGESWRPAVLRACCLDPDSKEPLFQPEDDIGQVPAAVTEPYVNAVVRLSAITSDEVEELEGNSERTPSGSTASD